MIEKTKKLNVAVQKEIKQIKIALIGDCMSGKSSFMSYYLNQTTNSSYTPTLGVDTGKKIIENKNGSISNINIWDFSGKLDFLDIRN